MDRMIVLIEEISLMKTMSGRCSSRYISSGNVSMGNLNTTINVLERRVEELKNKLRVR
jgi:hypothetical protein